MATVLGVGGFFGLIVAEAADIVHDVARAVATWREVAARQGLTPRQIVRMASAFEHDDMTHATRI